MFIDLTGMKWRGDYSYTNFSRYEMDELVEGIIMMQASGVSEHGGKYLGGGVVSGLAFLWMGTIVLDSCDVEARLLLY